MTNSRSLCICTLKLSSVKPLIVNCSPDGFGINHFLILLGTNGQGIRQQVIDQTGISLGKTMYGGECHRGGTSHTEAGKDSSRNHSHNL